MPFHSVARGWNSKIGVRAGLALTASLIADRTQLDPTERVPPARLQPVRLPVQQFFRKLDHRRDQAHLK